MGDGLLCCGACDRRASATAGTIFAGTRSPLSLWFAAAWYITNQKAGVSALGLQRALELGKPIAVAINRRELVSRSGHDSR